MKNFIIILLIACLFNCPVAVGQKTALKGTIGFKVTAPAKQVTAESADFILELDPENGRADFSVPVRSFKFSNNFVSDTLNDKLKLRFNDYYMESARYPSVIFKGSIAEFKLTKDGRYRAQGKGTLTAHGVSRKIDFKYDIEVRNKKVTVHATAIFVPAYFNVRIPALIGDFYFKTVAIELFAESR